MILEEMIERGQKAGDIFMTTLLPKLNKYDIQVLPTIYPTPKGELIYFISSMPDDKGVVKYYAREFHVWDSMTRIWPYQFKPFYDTAEEAMKAAEYWAADSMF